MDRYVQAFICMIPAFWIGFGFLSRAAFMLKGYPPIEGLLVGLLFGPLGVILGLLVPPYSKTVSRGLRLLGLLFAFNAFGLLFVLRLMDLGVRVWDSLLPGLLAEGILVAVGIIVIHKGWWPPKKR